jgi:hypothetical protein
MKKLGLILGALVIFAGAISLITYLTSPGKKTTKAPTQQVVKITPTTQTKKTDQQIVANMGQMLAIIANYYGVNNKSFPDSTAAGWQQILNEAPTTSVFVDPYTNTFYTWGSGTDPDYGQIQYAPNTTCSSDNGFIKNKYRSMALRVRTVGGVRCVSIDMQVKTDSPTNQ